MASVQSIQSVHTLGAADGVDGAAYAQSLKLANAIKSAVDAFEKQTGSALSSLVGDEGDNLFVPSVRRIGAAAGAELTPKLLARAYFTKADDIIVEEGFDGLNEMADDQQLSDRERQAASALIDVLNDAFPGGFYSAALDPDGLGKDRFFVGGINGAGHVVGVIAHPTWT